MYYKLYTSGNKVPIPIAIALLCLVFVVPFLYLKTRNQIPSTPFEITSVKAVNVTHASASIFWKTNIKTNGSLYYSDNSIPVEQISDDRNIEKQNSVRTYHFATLKNLKPNTDYSVWFSKPKSGQTPSLNFKTSPRASLSTNKRPLYGKVTDFTGGSVEGSIVLVDIKNANTLAALTKSDGGFLVSLCCLFRADTYEKIIPKDSDTVEINVYSEDKTSRIVSDVASSSPLKKTIVLGKDDNLLSMEETVSEKEDSTSTLNTSQNKFEEIDIFYPRQDSIIPGFKPLFKGSAIQNQRVTLTFPKEKKTLTLLTDNKGGWSYTPSFDLNAGRNTVVLETVDNKNKAIKKERVFTIAKSGESVVLGEATPEGTLTPTIPIISVTEIPIETPIIEPTLSMSPTPTPPVTGISFTTFSLFSIALIAVGGGLILLF